MHYSSVCNMPLNDIGCVAIGIDWEENQKDPLEIELW